MEAAAAGNRADSDGSGESAQPSFPPAHENGRAAQPSVPDRFLLQVQFLQHCSQAAAMSMVMRSQRRVPHDIGSCSPGSGSVPPEVLLSVTRLSTVIANPLQGG